MLGQQNRREIVRVLVVQLLFSVMCLATFRYMMGGIGFRSALYGACISILPTWLFAGMLFRYQGATQSKQIVHQMYVGEGIKIMVTATLFGVVIAWTHPCWWVLFVSFMITQLSLSVGPLCNWAKK